MNSTIPSQPEQDNVRFLATTVVGALVSRSSLSLFFFSFFFSESQTDAFGSL